jgi:hypothetical protein
MGRSVTPPYALEMDGATPMSWWVKRRKPFTSYGKPTAENLAKFMADYLKSLQPGGCNQHIAYVPRWARIVVNDGGRRVIAEWLAE